MRSSPLRRVSSADTALGVAQVGDLLRFARSLNAYRDSKRLLHSLPEELSSVVESDTTVLIHAIDGEFSWYAADGDGSPLGFEPELPQWRAEIREFLSAHLEPVVVASLSRETRFPSLVQFFRTHENQSMCILPLSKGPLVAG